MESVDTQFLISAGWDIPTPFRMSVPKPGCGLVEIQCVQIYRLLPGKRIVMLARDQGEPILVKAFLGRNANRNAAREVRGIEAITKAGVCTPELLWTAEIPGSGRMLALHFLPDAVSLFHQWDQADNVAEKNEILSSVMQIMSRLHQNGVIQKDIHLANFMLSNDKFHMIDGGGIQRKYSVSASEETSLLNLANFFAQFQAQNDDLVSSALKVYEQARGWTSDALDVSEHRRAKLLAEITRCRKIRKRNHIEKSLRNCTRFVCRSSFRSFMVCERSAYDNELQGLLRHPDRFIADGKLLKNGNSATVALVHLSDRPLVIKRYNIKGILHGARRLFRKSRARVSWSNAWHMEFLGIPALKPVAMIENRIGPFRTSAYLITEYIEGPDALHCLREMADPKGEPEALAQIIQQLSESWISHGDLKATNFLMARYGPVIIDLDAMQEHKNQSTFRRAFRNDLKRFMANWEDYPALSDRFMGLLSELDKRHGKQTDLAVSRQPVTQVEVSSGSQTGASNPLKVLQLCHDYQGPFQSVCWQYNQAFEKHDVTTVYLKGPRSEEVIRRTGGNRVLFFEQPHLRGMKIRSILALAGFFRKNRFNVVIAHRYKPIFLAGLMSYFFDIRLILGVAHEHDVFSRVARSRFVTFWRTNIFIVAVSDSVFRNIAQHCPSLVADKRLATLGHTLPEVELMDRETARQNLNLPEGFLFGCVGRLVTKKNHQLLIKAFARAGLGKDCFLVFFGTGPQAKKLSDMTASSGMDNQVLFKGFVDWAARYYRAFDTFVFPSGSDEAYGVVLLEAMQAELPILASNAAGPCEILGDVGIRFTMDDVDSLAAKLRLMVEQNERWRLDMGRASKRRFDSEFTISSFIEKFNNLPPIVQLTQ